MLVGFRYTFVEMVCKTFVNEYFIHKCEIKIVLIVNRGKKNFSEL